MKRREFLKAAPGALALASLAPKALARTEPRGLAVMVPPACDGAARPFRLYCDASRRGGRPRPACDPIRVPCDVARRFAETGLISPSAIDRIFEIRNHPILDALDDPCPEIGRSDRAVLVGAIRASLAARGRAYILPDGNGWDFTEPGPSRKKGPPERAWLLDPAYVVPLRKPNSPTIEAYGYLGERIRPDDLVEFRTHGAMSPDDVIADTFTRLAMTWDRRLFFAFDPAPADSPVGEERARDVAIWDRVLAIGPRPAKA